MIPSAANETDPVRKKILAAMDRLLDGKPLRSTGRLSISQLAVEAGLGRWHLTHQHTDLQELFQARVKASKSVAESAEPTEYQELEAKYAKLLTYVAELEHRVALYANVINLLDLERQDREDREAVGAVANIDQLRPARRTH